MRLFPQILSVVSCLVLIGLWSSPLPSQAAVKDINTTQDDSSNPGGPSGPNQRQSFYAQVGTKTFFAATISTTTGRELCAYDSATNKTALVLDIRKGDLSSDPLWLTAAGNIVFFSALADGGRELWKSDGTAAGTVRVKDIRPGGSYGSPSELVAIGNNVVFSATDGKTGLELWKSDGTTAGTTLVKDIRPGSSSSTPRCAHGAMLGANVLMFRATDGKTGNELWKTDGTTAGTVLVKDIRTGSGSSDVWDFGTIGKAVIFSANDGSGIGEELFKSDGTAAGTVLLKDIRIGANLSSSPNFMRSAGSRVYFEARGHIPAWAGYELWTSDGTTTGTVCVADLQPGSGNSTPRQMTSVGSTLYFTAAVAKTKFGRELYKTDGTTAGTSLVLDINPGTPGSNPQALTNVGGTLFFSALTAAGGRELYKSDGTAAGTVLVKDFWTGPIKSGEVSNLSAAGKKLIGAATDAKIGNEPFTSDGTTAGTAHANLNTAPPPSYPTNLVRIGGTLYFFCDDGLHGKELWKSDGTTAGTAMVKDIYPGNASSQPMSLVTLGDLLIFSAIDGKNGREVWKSDGTAAGTAMIKNLQPGTEARYPVNIIAFNGEAYFDALGNALKPNPGRELFKTDGTAAGTVLVKDIRPGGSWASPGQFAVVGKALYFEAFGNGTGYEIYKTDGTTAGTVLLKDIRTGTGNSTVRFITDVGGIGYFRANNGTNGAELWKTDGTTAGTVLVADLRVGSGSSDPTSITAMGGACYFYANDGKTGQELYKTDGTAAGTAIVKELRAGTLNSIGGPIVAANGTLFFRGAGPNPAGGWELWKSDGTAAGTMITRDIWVGGGSALNPFTAFEIARAGVGTRVVVAAKGNKPATGKEIFVSDGTAAGTTLVKDVIAGNVGSNPNRFFTIGRTMFYVANDGKTGTELHSVSLATLGASNLENYGTGCAGSAGNVPDMSGIGVPSLGNAKFTLRLGNAKTGAPCVLLAGAAKSKLPLGNGCTLLVMPIISVPSVTSKSGDAKWTLPVPNNNYLMTASIYFTGAAIDAGGKAFGVAAIANGLEMIVGL